MSHLPDALGKDLRGQLQSLSGKGERRVHMDSARRLEGVFQDHGKAPLVTGSERPVKEPENHIAVRVTGKGNADPFLAFHADGAGEIRQRKFRECLLPAFQIAELHNLAEVTVPLAHQ